MLINIDEKKKTDKLEITKKSETLKKRFHVKIIILKQILYLKPNKTNNFFYIPNLKTTIKN